jgi:predicted ATP-dependent serine protease
MDVHTGMMVNAEPSQRIIKKESTPQNASEIKLQGNGVSARELAEKVLNNKPIIGFEFLGNVPDKFTILLYGGEGGGKSTFSVRFANRIAETGMVYYFATEEGQEADSLIQRIQDNKIHTDNMKFFEDSSMNEIIERIKTGKPRHVFIDSISEIKFNPAHLLMIKRLTPGIFLSISHANKRNDYAGPRTIGHFFDIKLRAHEGIVHTGKHRFGTSGKKHVVYVPENKKESPNLQTV